MRGILPSICQSHEMTLPAGDQPWGEGGVLLFRSKVLFKAENLPIVPLSRETDLTLIIIIIIIIILKKKKKKKMLVFHTRKRGPGSKHSTQTIECKRH